MTIRKQAVEKKIFYFVLIFCCLYVTATSRCYADNTIPLDLAKKAIVFHMKLHYGKIYKTKEPVIFYNLESKPDVYVFTVYKGEGDMPSDQDILNEGRLNYNMLLNAKLTKTEGWKKIRRDGEFAAAYVGATEEEGPLIMYYDSLPLQYVSIFEAEDKAREALGTDLINIKRYYWIGFFGFMVEFSDTEGRSVIIEISVDHDAPKVFTNKEFDDLKAKAYEYKKRLKSGSKERIEFEKKRLEDIKESWQKIKEQE